MNRYAYLLVIAAALTSLTAAGSGEWTGGMEDGSVIRIDPDSNQATRYSGDGAIQLWDGVHRMQDGSTLTVVDGVVTSRTEGERETPVFTPSPSDPSLTPSACVALVIKVCGFNGECRENPPCSPARQLMELEKNEAWQTRQAGPNQTTSQCLTALENEDFFVSCESSLEKSQATACDKLVDHVCGKDRQCAKTPACSEAIQYQKMEQREQARNRNRDRLTPASEQCEQALSSGTGFPACID